MYRYIGGEYAYDMFNSIATTLTLIASLFYFKIKRESISIFSKYVIGVVSQKDSMAGKLVEFLLVSAESLLMAEICILSTNFNRTFGDLVGTGANYFAVLIFFPIFLFLASMLIMSNPIKQMDIVTLFLPFFLIFVKIACFLNGCCWGIPWEYGPYNRHIYHPGHQVPVQAIESFLALVIFVFLLFYRKKAKIGTMFPIYLILYSATRFPVEFLSGAHKPVIGPFNMYHILCLIGVVIGLLWLFIVRRYGEKISDFFEKPSKKIEMKMAIKSDLKAQKIAEENARAEAEMKERLEKAKRARAKASVKYKK